VNKDLYNLLTRHFDIWYVNGGVGVELTRTIFLYVSNWDSCYTCDML